MEDKIQKIKKELANSSHQKDLAKLEIQLMEIPVADYSHRKSKENLSLLKKETPKIMLKPIEDGNVVFYKGKDFITVVGSIHGKLTAFDEMVLKAGVFSNLFEVEGDLVYFETRVKNLDQRLGLLHFHIYFKFCSKISHIKSDIVIPFSAALIFILVLKPDGILKR